MSSLNQVQLIGNIGKEPEIKYTPSGKAVCKFSLATQSRFKKNGNVNTKTEWHNIVAWNKTAELIGEYLHKGSKVFISGSLQAESWEYQDKKYYRTNIVAKKVIFLSFKKDDEDPDDDDDSSYPDVDPSNQKDDIPF